MAYEYGSPPEPQYDYRCFIKHLAPHLPKDDKVFFHEGALEWRANHNAMPLTLFKNICHWKSPRPFGRVCANTADEVNERWRRALTRLHREPFQDDDVAVALAELTQLNGVEVRTASALLTAWNPKQFGILDFKVLKVLDLPQNQYSPQSYIAYRRRLLELRDELPELHACALRQIELALWHFYAVQEIGDRDLPGYPPI